MHTHKQPGSFFQQMTNKFHLILLIFTYLCLNLVGLNLLIAMMSSTYAKVSARAQSQSWVYTYALVQEYSQRAIAFPPPLNLISLMWDLILFFWYKKKIRYLYPDYTFGQRLDRFLARNEHIAKAQRVRGATHSNKENDEDRRIQEKISAFMEHARRSVMNKEHPKDSLDGKLDSIASEIKHMQVSLQGKGSAAGVKEEPSTDFTGAKQREREKRGQLRTKFSKAAREVGKLALCVGKGFEPKQASEDKQIGIFVYMYIRLFVYTHTTQSRTHALSPSLPPSLPRARARARSLSLSLSHTHTRTLIHIYAHKQPCSHTHMYIYRR
jgi:hypothetical protein